MPAVEGGQLLAQIERENPKLGQLLRTRIISGINQLAQNMGAAPVGHTDSPNPPNGLNVKVSGELAHVTIQDNNQIQKHANYFVEYSNNPQFSQPHVEHLGPSRGKILNLPTNNDAGVKHNWYFRTYAQYPGSQPSEPVVYGGNNPIAVNMGGTTNLTPLSSTGSGTAPNDGQSGGSGFGKVQLRGAPAPKRNV